MKGTLTIKSDMNANFFFHKINFWKCHFPACLKLRWRLGGPKLTENVC